MLEDLINKKGNPVFRDSPFVYRRSDWIRTSDPYHPKVVRYPGCATLRTKSLQIYSPGEEKSSSLLEWGEEPECNPAQPPLIYSLDAS